MKKTSKKPAKKSLNVSGTHEETDVVETIKFIDLGDARDVKEREKPAKPAGEAQEAEYYIEEILIEPAGYPFRAIGSDQAPGIVVDDPDLFQKYCAEQWSSMFVDVGTFLFDAYLFPDYAFQVMAVKPFAGKVGPDTKILLRNRVQAITSTISPVSLAEVVGQEDAKKKCRVILKYLDNPSMFGSEWAPRNVLFHGPPGTGKTLLARALASEAKASFFSRNATTLIGVHVGDGAKKIHDLYEHASAHAPCIVFIDELDAIGLSRSFQHVRGDVIEVSTALLSEMDGMAANKGVVTIGATNQATLLDPALRSRFEEEILFNAPTLDERVALIELYRGKVPLKFKIDARALAARLDGWNGRDIKEKLVKNLVHDAILENRKVITTEFALDLLARIQKREPGSSKNPLAF